MSQTEALIISIATSVALVTFIFLLLGGRKKDEQQEEAAAEPPPMPEPEPEAPVPPPVTLVVVGAPALAAATPAVPAAPGTVIAVAAAPAAMPESALAPASDPAAKPDTEDDQLPAPGPVPSSSIRLPSWPILVLLGIVLVGLVLVLSWQAGADPYGWAKEHYIVLAASGLMAAIFLFTEWRRPGATGRSWGYLWQPPLFKFLALSGLTMAGLVAGAYWYDLNYLAFVEQDKTPISLGILAAAVFGWLEGLCQAFALTARISEFNQLERLVAQTATPSTTLPANGGRLAAIIDKARSRMSIVDEYIIRVYATGGQQRPSQDMLIDNLEDRLVQGARISHAMYVAIPVFGLIGTIIGMKMGIDGMSQAAGGDAAQLSTSANLFLGGLNTALNTTLIGSLLGGVYFFFQHRILMDGALLLKCSVSDFVQVAVVSHEAQDAAPGGHHVPTAS